MIVLLLAVIIASNVYGDLEVVNVKIGTYRKDHPSLAYATRQTLANDIKGVVESCGKQFNTNALKIDEGNDFNYKISFKAFCECAEVCSLLEALKWNWDAFLYGYVSCKSLSDYKNNEVVISHFHFNNVTCRYCFSDITENFVEACPRDMLRPTKNNSYSKYVGKTQYPVQLWVHRKEHWSQDEEINRKYVDELENELNNYATSQGINFKQEYVTPKRDYKFAQVTLVYYVVSASCEEAEKFIDGAKEKIQIIATGSALCGLQN